MQYKYPRTQTQTFDAFFVMAADFDSGKYNEYVIVEDGTGKEYRFKHDVIVEHLKKNSHDRQSRPTFQNGAPFIRLLVSLAEK